MLPPCYLAAPPIEARRRRDSVSYGVAGVRAQDGRAVATWTPPRILLRHAVDDGINHHKDCVAIVDLGDRGGSGIECFAFMGMVSPLPAMGSQIV